MDYFVTYPDIEQKKHKSKKVSCALDFWNWAKNWHRSSQAYHLKIGLTDFRNLS